MSLTCGGRTAGNAAAKIAEKAKKFKARHAEPVVIPQTPVITPDIDVAALHRQAELAQRDPDEAESSNAASLRADAEKAKRVKATKKNKKNVIPLDEWSAGTRSAL